jgi:hypothetical protein
MLLSPEVLETDTVLLITGWDISFTWKVAVEASLTFSALMSVTICTSFIAKFAVIVIGVVTFWIIRGFAVPYKLPLQFTKWYPLEGTAVTSEVEAPLFTV